VVEIIEVVIVTQESIIERFDARRAQRRSRKPSQCYRPDAIFTPGGIEGGVR
jgi:hypothetical protein